MIIKDAATGITLLSLAHKPFTPSSMEFGPRHLPESIIRFCGSLQHGHSTQDFPIQT